MSSSNPSEQAAERGVYGAVMDLMDAAGGYPITRRSVLDAIENGVYRAMRDHLQEKEENDG